MVTRSFSLSSILMFALLALVGCDKDAGPGADIAPEALARIAQESACGSLQYADSVFYYQEQESRYEVSPNRKQSGIYGAFPDGLAIDSRTGAIDVNKSESGLKYRVWFKAKNSKDTCTTFVTISGINYRSRIYNLSAGDATAAPFYNGLANQKHPGADDKSGASSEFDNDKDPVVKAKAELSSKKGDGIVIDKVSGAIDLRSVVASGVFGKKPANGTVHTFRLFYRLNDKSKKSLNYIDVRLHYYSKVTDVPANVMMQANVKTQATFRQATTMIPHVEALNYSSDDFESDSKKPRPPDIIIVGN